MDKVEVARRQLGAALHLFLADGDSVSVQCLACGGGEVAEHLATASEKTNFFSTALQFGGMSIADMRQARNLYWNAFKHYLGRDGDSRDDTNLLQSFGDEDNISMLFVGWYDYAQAVGALPIEAQVFQIWVWARRPDKLSDKHDREFYRRLFPKLDTLALTHQKDELHRRIEWARQQNEVTGDVKTDPRPLLLGAVS